MAEVITLEGDQEDSETILSTKVIDNETEKLKGTENTTGEESTDREQAREETEDCKLIEEDKEDIEGNKEHVTEEKESGSKQPRDPVDHDYEADTRADVSTESGCSVEGLDTITSKSGSCSNSSSLTTEKESSPGTSLRLVSLSNLVPNSPPPSEPEGNPAPSWTVAEVARYNLILF